MSPPRIAAVLFVLLMAIPLTFLGRYFYSESTPYTIPKANPPVRDDTEAKKADKGNIENAFVEFNPHTVKTFSIKRDKEQVPEQKIQEVPKPKLVDQEERDVCQKDGGHKVKHGRHGWRCVYPHKHRRK